MMHMTFYWGRKATILFDFWKTDSWADYSLSLFVCLLFAVFYQYMEDRRLRLKLLSLKSSKSSSPGAVGINSPLLYPRFVTDRGRFSVARAAGAVLFGVNSAIGYLLMLAVMSFNAGVFVAVVVGLAVGYLMFRSADEDVIAVENPCACA